jgi:ribonuclease III
MKSGALEKKIGYVFRNPDLLTKALTHSSFAYEKPNDGPGDNERLEFLGDSVIGLAAADFYYGAYPDLGEGELSKLKSTSVSTLALSEYARKWKLDKAMLLGRGEEKCGGRKKNSILAGVFEAVVGAVFLDGGLEPSKKIMAGLLASTIKPIRRDEFEINNPKSALQENFQKSGLPAPQYRTLKERGPDHEKTFVVEVLSGGKRLAEAKGRSRKTAEQNAARKALKSMLGRRMKILSPESFIIEKKD